MKKRVIFTGLLCVFLLAGIFSVWAGGSRDSGTEGGAPNFPTKDINIIVPYGIGGNADTIARLMGQYLGEELGVRFIPINRPGAGSDLGILEVAGSAPDGYTIGIASHDTLVSQILKPDFDFDYKEDLTWMCAVTMTPFTFWAGTDDRFNTWEKFLGYAKTHPGELAMAETGPSGKLLALDLMKKFGIQLTLVNYSSAVEGLTALMGGHVSSLVSGSNIISNVTAAGGAPLLWAYDTPSVDFPNAPLFKDLGIDNYNALATIWYIVAPKGLPDHVLKTLEDAFSKVVKIPEFEASIRNLDFGYFPIVGDKEIMTRIPVYYDQIKTLADNNPGAF